MGVPQTSPCGALAMLPTKRSLSLRVHADSPADPQENTPATQGTASLLCGLQQMAGLVQNLAGLHANSNNQAMMLLAQTAQTALHQQQQLATNALACAVEIPKLHHQAQPGAPNLALSPPATHSQTYIERAIPVDRYIPVFTPQPLLPEPPHHAPRDPQLPAAPLYPQLPPPAIYLSQHFSQNVPHLEAPVPIPMITAPYARPLLLAPPPEPSLGDPEETMAQNGEPAASVMVPVEAVASAQAHQNAGTVVAMVEDPTPDAIPAPLRRPRATMRKLGLSRPPSTKVDKGIPDATPAHRKRPRAVKAEDSGMDLPPSEEDQPPARPPRQRRRTVWYGVKEGNTTSEGNWDIKDCDWTIAHAQRPKRTKRADWPPHWTAALANHKATRGNHDAMRAHWMTICDDTHLRAHIYHFVRPRDRELIRQWEAAARAAAEAQRDSTQSTSQQPVDCHHATWVPPTVGVDEPLKCIDWVPAQEPPPFLVQGVGTSLHPTPAPAGSQGHRQEMLHRLGEEEVPAPTPGNTHTAIHSPAPVDKTPTHQLRPIEDLTKDGDVEANPGPTTRHTQRPPTYAEAVAMPPHPHQASKPGAPQTAQHSTSARSLPPQGRKPRPDPLAWKAKKSPAVQETGKPPSTKSHENRSFSATLSPVDRNDGDTRPMERPTTPPVMAYVQPPPCPEGSSRGQGWGGPTRLGVHHSDNGRLPHPPQWHWADDFVEAHHPPHHAYHPCYSYPYSYVPWPTYPIHHFRGNFASSSPGPWDHHPQHWDQRVGWEHPTPPYPYSRQPQGGLEHRLYAVESALLSLQCQLSRDQGTPDSGPQPARESRLQQCREQQDFDLESSWSGFQSAPTPRAAMGSRKPRSWLAWRRSRAFNSGEVDSAVDVPAEPGDECHGSYGTARSYRPAGAMPQVGGNSGPPECPKDHSRPGGGREIRAGSGTVAAGKPHFQRGELKKVRDNPAQPPTPAPTQESPKAGKRRRRKGKGSSKWFANKVGSNSQCGAAGSKEHSYHLRRVAWMAACRVGSTSRCW